jgi:peptide/nickel transport system permease protein
MIAVGISSAPSFARIVRGSVLVVKNMEFVEAARALGAGKIKILNRHILPNTLASIVVMATLATGGAILTEAGLSFLGIGIQPPQPSWGGMLSDGRAFLRDAPWISTFPGLAIMICVLGFNLFGDGIRDALDPRLAHAYGA